MRRYRSALILLLVLALLAGGYYFYTAVWPKMKGGDGDDKKPATASTTENIKLVDRKSDELEELTVNYLSEEYVAVKETVMEKTEGSDKEREVIRWKLANRKDIKVDPSKLSTAASNFCTITSSKTIDENASDLAQFGLEGAGQARVSGKFNDGSVITLIIGDKNPTRDGYYVRKENENAVYLGSSYSSEKMMLKKAEITDLTLFGFEEPDIAQIEMGRGGSPLFIVNNKGNYKWELEFPVTAPFNSTAQGQILESVAALSASSYEEMDAADLAKYGLEIPKYSLKIKSNKGGAPVELLFGKEKAVRSTAYAMLGGTNDVFVVSITNFGYLDKPMKEFVDVFAYIVNINTVTHIKAEFDGKTVLCDITAELGGDTDNDVFIVDGNDVSKLENSKGKSLFRAFYQGLIGVTIYDLEIDAVPSGAPEITFLYELKEEPFNMLVEFIPKDERLYYVMRNGKYAGITVEKRIFDKPEEGLRATYEALKQGIEDAAQGAA